MIRVLLFVFASACSLAAGSPRSDVWKARVMLSPEAWSGVVEITNDVKHPVYPKVTHALVFEFNRVLWLYTPYDGTQSLSMTYGNTAKDRENLLPLLKAVCPGFSGYKEVAIAPADAFKDNGPPANACFIEAIAALGERIDSRSRIRRAALLSIYIQGRLAGHTVVSYETDEGHFVFDAIAWEKPLPVEHGKADDPLLVAKVAYPNAKIAKARFMELSQEALPSKPARIASRAKGETVQRAG